MFWVQFMNSSLEGIVLLSENIRLCFKDSSDNFLTFKNVALTIKIVKFLCH